MALNIDWLRTAFEATGKSKATLGRALDIDATNAGRLLAGERRIMAADLPVLARLLGITLDELIRNLGIDEPGEAVVAEEPALPVGAVPLEPLSRHEAWDRNPMRDLPVYGRAVGGSPDVDMAYEFDGEALDYIARPSVLSGTREAYGLFVSGTSMEPRYMEGETIYVNPSRPVRSGSFVVAQLRPKRPGDPVRGLVKQLVARTPTKIILRSLNPPDAPVLEFPLEQIAKLHLIVLGGEG
jgi:phage repressor protein C with HTH and peptisase S24 domain